MCFHKACCLLQFLLGSKAATLNRQDTMFSHRWCCFFFQFLQGARTHTSQGDECSGARPLRDSYGTLTGPFGPIRIQTNANSCNSIWNEADHGIHCPSMALVLVYPKLRRSTESDTHAFKMDQSTEPDNFIPTKGNSSKQLRLQTNWRVSITNHFDLC